MAMATAAGMGIGAACLAPTIVGTARQVRPGTRLQRVRRLCVAELSRDGGGVRWAPRTLAPAPLVQQPILPSFLGPPPPAPTQSPAPAPTPPPLPDSGVGKVEPDPEGLTEDSVDKTIFVASEQDSEIMDVKEQAHAKVTRSIVFVTGEASPYAKSGGLGDVCGSLPIALAVRGHRVMVVMPRYMNGVLNKNFANVFYTEKHIRIPCFGGEHEVSFFHEYRDSVDWVFVDHPSYHRPGNLYGDNFGAFGDNQFRYTLLCYAACEAPLILELGGYIYGQKCMFVVNDWHASLVPVYDLDLKLHNQID